jgi:hypothetical protein
MRPAEILRSAAFARWRPWAVLAIVYVALALPWPGLGRAFVGGYGALFEPVLETATALDGISLRATEPGEAGGEWDLALRFPPAPGSTTIHGIRVHMRRVAYVPFAMLAALCAAFPPVRSRRWALAACPAALLFLQLVALLSMFVTRGLASYGSVADALIVMESRALFEAPAMAFVLPALLWGLLRRPFDVAAPVTATAGTTDR